MQQANDEKPAADAGPVDLVLGPLPDCYSRFKHEAGMPLYSADQMRAYAAEQVAAERERFAEVCNAYAVRLRAMPYPELPTPVEVANDLRDLALGPNA